MSTNTRVCPKCFKVYLPHEYGTNLCPKCHFVKMVSNQPWRNSITLDEKESEKLIERMFKDKI